MLKKLLVIFLSISLLATTSSCASKPTPPNQTSPRKQKLVLIPIVLNDEERKLRGQIETALVSGLQEKYTVYSGDNVLQKQREVFDKESKEAKGLCDETKCMQDLAEGFGSELVAVIHITKEEGNFFKSGRYILSINIQNIFDNKAVYNNVIPSKNTDTLELLDKLKELGRGEVVVLKTPEVITPPTPPVKEEKPIQPTKADDDSLLWAEAQKGNTLEDYQVYVDTHPKGKYVGLAKARIKKFKAEQTPKPEPIAPPPQKVENSPDNESLLWIEAQNGNTTEDYTAYLDTYPKGKYASLAKARIKKFKAEQVIVTQPMVSTPQKTIKSKDVFFDKSAGLMWQDNEEAKTLKLNWQGAMDYCENLTLAGRSDWRLPDVDILKALSPKKEYLSNVVSDAYWSSSSTVNNSSSAWNIFFDYGRVGNNLKGSSLYVRCVRDSK